MDITCINYSEEIHNDTLKNHVTDLLAYLSLLLISFISVWRI